MKNLKVCVLAVVTSLFVFSCQKDDPIEESTLANDSNDLEMSLQRRRPYGKILQIREVKPIVSSKRPVVVMI